MVDDLVLPWSSEYEGFLRDESRRAGTAESISFPTTEEDVVAVVQAMHARGVPVTTQGARTGIVAGAVPQGGHVLNLSRMNAVGQCRQDAETGEHYITVQPGALLTAVREVVERQGLFFPPDPTETTASLGGMIAANASGALTFAYGPTRTWVQALRVVLADGSVLALRRGQCLARGRHFTLRTEAGREITGTLPAYPPPATKSAAGYFVAPGMDLVDLFIGMEGTLGVVTEAELRLLPRPPAVVGLTAFLPSEEAALTFVRFARGEAACDLAGLSTRPVAIEFFNSDALNLLRRMKADNPAFAGIPALKEHYHTAVYLEFHGESDEALEDAVLDVTEAMLALGASDEDSWFATNARELAPLKAFRHATPEAVNLLIDQRRRTVPTLTKLGTDMSVTDADLEWVMALYREGLRAAGLESVIFGHIGNNHVHVNILPHDMEEYDRGKALYLSWAGQIVARAGSVSAEHGIGKLKVPFLRLMVGEEGIAQMRALKQVLDPEGILNRGNLF